ncbi:MAG: hypothetical protein BZY88_02190 [SAR202 cluster bacterium Io17-Chloro-G9]|nr:MAG: hypothetical protein BZY88_02190 [SAR202 cluster bacterium Io17-Chloro-G9]
MKRTLQSWWTYVVLGLVGFYLLLYLFLDLPSNLRDTPAVDPMRTLLGALATGLITAQALVFTIALVAAQLNARYTHRMVSRIFTWPTALYMGLFIGSSVYSMIVMATLSARSTDYAINLPVVRPVHPVTVAIALAGTCLVLLVPYLWSFKKRLDPERMAIDEGIRAERRLKQGSGGEPQEVAALDNIIMSAYGYNDYDTFATGLRVLGQVAVGAWELSLPRIGESVVRRIGHIGVATVDDRRAPFQVIEVLDGAGAYLAGHKMEEAARLVAATMSEIGEGAAERFRSSPCSLVASSLSALGCRAADLGLAATAEETAYSLGYLGAAVAQRGMQDSTRQVAALLGRIGIRAAERNLDLVTRQALISLWSLGAQVCLHLPQHLDVVAGEIETLERSADQDLAVSSYLSAPRSQALEDFRVRYKERSQSNVNEGDKGKGHG